MGKALVCSGGERLEIGFDPRGLTDKVHRWKMPSLELPGPEGGSADEFQASRSMRSCGNNPDPLGHPLGVGWLLKGGKPPYRHFRQKCPGRCQAKAAEMAAALHHDSLWKKTPDRFQHPFLELTFPKIAAQLSVGIEPSRAVQPHKATPANGR